MKKKFFFLLKKPQRITKSKNEVKSRKESPRKKKVSSEKQEAFELCFFFKVSCEKKNIKLKKHTNSYLDWNEWEKKKKQQQQR